MSVIEVTELPQWTMSTNEKREASYVRVFRVVTDSKSDGDESF